jgi:hypothetical protein
MAEKTEKKAPEAKKVVNANLEGRNECGVKIAKLSDIVTTVQKEK